MSLEIILFIGLQGAGKTTFFRRHFAATHAHVSRDNFPNVKNKDRRQEELIRAAIEAGQSVVVDNTHVSRAQRLKVLDLARELAIPVVGYYFEAELADCLQRNARRVGKARVPDIALHIARQNWDEPTLEEGFARIIRVEDFEKTMKNHKFAAQMRAGERFHALTIPADAWAIVRVDGRNFSRLTEEHFLKPFDALFKDYMVQTARVLLEELGGELAYLESDEISVLLAPNWAQFGREVEKTVSLSAAIATAAFCLSWGKTAHFDSRIWVGETREAVEDYFRWRQSDAARCALNGWCYWTLRQNGFSARDATQEMDGTTPDEKRAILARYEKDFSHAPLWQTRGIGFWWENYEKSGFDLQTKEPVVALRRRVKVEEELPERWWATRLERHDKRPNNPAPLA